MTKIFANIKAFQEREDKKENGVSPSFVKNNPTWEKDNETNEGCWNCSYLFKLFKVYPGKSHVTYKLVI